MATLATKVKTRQNGENVDKAEKTEKYFFIFQPRRKVGIVLQNREKDCSPSRQQKNRMQLFYKKLQRMMEGKR